MKPAYPNPFILLRQYRGILHLFERKGKGLTREFIVIHNKEHKRNVARSRKNAENKLVRPILTSDTLCQRTDQKGS